MAKRFRSLAALVLALSGWFVWMAPSTASASPAINLSPGTLEYGEVQVGTIKFVPLTITNTGTTTLSLGYGSTGVPVERDFSHETCQNSLAAGASCTQQIGFRVTRTGTYQAGVYQLYTAAPGSPHSIPLHVTGVVPPGVPSLQQGSVYMAFGDVEIGASGAQRTMKLTNLGNVPLAINQISVVGKNASDFSQTNTCKGTLVAGEECTVTVTFAPTVAELRTGILRVEDSAAGSPHDTSLNGAGAPSGSCFAATKFCASGQFFGYWQEHGGLAINGYPISAGFYEQLEDGRFYFVQYFERVRMEYHEEVQPPIVLLGQFGRKLHPADPAVIPAPGMTYFGETGHNVPPDFIAYWLANGGLAQFGFPLSEVFTEVLEDGKQYEVQYFERARFERHPENPAPYNILLGQFGRRVCGSNCR